MSGTCRPHRMPGGTAALYAGIAMLSTLLALALVWFSMRGVYSAPAGYQAASEVTDRLQGKQMGNGTEAADTDDAAYPEIDWAYWRGVNPDVVAWITIPDTPVDFPVAYAPKKCPDYYLEHDVYGNFNYFGCIFADPVCPDGLDSRNCILYGHNMSWDDSMSATCGPVSHMMPSERAFRLVIKGYLDFRQLHLSTGSGSSAPIGAPPGIIATACRPRHVCIALIDNYL